MVISQAVAPARVAAHGQWIISAPDDLVWFIGSVGSSYAILGLAYLGVPPFLLLILWATLFDGTHFFATWSRTYFDTEERRLHGRLLGGCLAFFALGPIVYLAGYGSLFFSFAGLWAYYHLVKQQYGFMMLYKNKNRDLARVDNTIDRAFLVLALWYPFARFMFANQSAQHWVAAMAPLVAVFEQILWWALVASTVAFAVRQGQKLARGDALNMPKHLLLAAAIPMHWTVFTFIPRDTFGYILAIPAVTIFHNIQYHRLIWFHNRNKYDTADAAQRFGLASVISRRFRLYAGLALACTLAYEIPRYLVFPTDGWVATLFWGYTFTHYYLDGKIWRIRHDPGLSVNLRMARSYAA